MSKRNGREIVVKVGSATVGEIVSQSLSFDRAMLDTSSKTSGESTEQIPGRYTWSIDFTVNTDDADTTGQGVVEADAISGTSKSYTFGKGTPATGDVSYSGTAYVSNFSKSDDDEAVSTASFTLSGTGALTRSVAA